MAEDTSVPFIIQIVICRYVKGYLKLAETIAWE